MTVIYEDNHIIVINKTASEIVQGDKTGDTPLSETVKQYIKEKYAKPGNVFIGVTHRLDRPVSGLVILAKTSKALSRLNEMFKNSEVKKTYWAIVKKIPKEPEGELVHFLVRNEKQNKSYAYEKLGALTQPSGIFCRFLCDLFRCCKILFPVLYRRIHVFDRPGVLFLYLAAHRNLLIFFHVKSPFLKSLIPFEKVLLFQTPVPIIKDM